MKNWKEYIESISNQSINLAYRIAYREEDYDEIILYSMDRHFECSISTFDYFNELSHVVINYRKDDVDFVVERPIEGITSFENKHLIEIMNNYLSPFVFEGWWIQKKKFLGLFMYSSSMLNKRKSKSIGPTFYHNWGLIFWILSIFDLLSINEWVYVKPLIEETKYQTKQL